MVLRQAQNLVGAASGRVIRLGDAICGIKPARRAALSATGMRLILRCNQPRSRGITATVKREMQTSLPPSSSMRIDQTWLDRPSASGRAVA